MQEVFSFFLVSLQKLCASIVREEFMNRTGFKNIKSELLVYHLSHSSFYLGKIATIIFDILVTDVAVESYFVINSIVCALHDPFIIK